MGFDVNFNNKPIIQEAKSMHNDGGAGNTGYFEQGENEKKSEHLNASIFDSESDSFKKSGQDELETDDFSFSKLIAQIILAIKDFFKKLFS